MVSKICDNPMIYPTIVFTISGRAIKHIVAVAKDLLFDPTGMVAMKLCIQAFKWVCNGPPQLDAIFRFQMAVREQGNPKSTPYAQTMQCHS